MKLFAIVFTIYLYCHLSRALQDDPDDQDIVANIIVDEEDINEDELIKSVQTYIFGQAPSKTDIEKTIERVDRIIKGKQPLREASRNQLYDKEAKNLLKLISGASSWTPVSMSESHPIKRPSYDPDYCPDTMPPSKGPHFKISSMRTILKLVRRGRTEDSIRKVYPSYRRQYKKRFEQCIAEGDSRSVIRRMISSYALNRFKDAREHLYPVRGHNIRDWATQEAIRLNATFFSPTVGWLNQFKLRHGIVSRKITKYIGACEIKNREERDKNITDFKRMYGRWRHFFRYPLVWNMDQTGFNYEQSTARTLSWKGERDTYASVDSKGKSTHSYTAQPVISRDGKTIGKLLLCFQEKNGKFGPQVTKTVDNLVGKYGNIRAVASSSGLMTKELMADWAETVLNYAAREHVNEIDNETEVFEPENLQPIDELMREGHLGMDEDDRDCYERREREGSRYCEEELEESPEDRNVPLCRDQMWNRIGNECLSKPKILLIADSWSGNRAIHPIVRNEYVKTIHLPPGCTSEIQPLDVGFNRQYKLFVNRITEQAIYSQAMKRITSREGIMNMQSLVWNQFSSPAYQDLIRHAWHNLDPLYDASLELSNDPPNTVRKIQFSFPRGKCQVEDCNHDAFIRCSHCGRLLCFHHFLDRKCFHHSHEELNTTIEYDYDRSSEGVEDELENDDEFLDLAFPGIAQGTGSSRELVDTGHEDRR